MNELYEVKTWILVTLVMVLIAVVSYFLKNEHGKQMKAEAKANLDIKEITTMFTDAVLSFNKSIAELTLVIKDLELKIIKEYVTNAEFDKTITRLDKDISGVGDRFRREMDSCVNRKVC